MIEPIFKQEHMMRRTFFAMTGLGLLALTALASPVMAATTSATNSQAVDKSNQAGQVDLLTRFMSDKRPAQAQFTQKDEQGVAKGHMTVASQGKLRWAQTTPYETLLVSNGKVAWQVDSDLMQATRLDAKMTEGWAGVFGNRAVLEKTYTIEQKGQRITLTPKSKDGVKGTIDFDSHGNPVVVRFGAGAMERNRDATTEIRFTGWTRLKAEPKGLFDYRPAKGMDIIGAN